MQGENSKEWNLKTTVLGEWERIREEAEVSNSESLYYFVYGIRGLRKSTKILRIPGRLLLAS